MLRRTLVLLITLATGLSIGQSEVLRVATIGEPPMLDPMATTATLTGEIAQHVFETLYTFDANWEVVPLIAQTLPTISDDGLQLTIPIREGIVFHDGSDLDGEDVVASLRRWTEVSTRGKGAAPFIESIEAVDRYTVEIVFNEPYSPLTSYLAMNTAAAVVIPSELAELDGALTEYVGSGPFEFLEWRPDRYIRLERFDDYRPRSEDPSGYGGRRTAEVGELRFIPVSDANTRISGLLGGEYDFADALNTESLPRLQGNAAVTPMVVQPFAFPVMIINVAAGALVDVDVRRAVQAAMDHESMLLAGLGGPEFYDVNGSYYPEGAPYYSTAGTENFNVFDVELAKEMLAASSYDGEPIRILSSQQYEFLYRMSIVAAENLRSAGFNVDLQVVEWATLTERRADPDAWEAYWTYGSFNPEPTSYSFLVGPGHGKWSPPEKEEILRQMNAARTTEERAELWGQLQELLYDQVPVVKIGDMFGLTGVSSSVRLDDSYVPVTIPYFWNVGVE